MRWGTNEARELSFLATGMIGVGATAREMYWDIKKVMGEVVLEIRAEDRPTYVLKQSEGVWSGHLKANEKTAIVLRPLRLIRTD